MEERTECFICSKKHADDSRCSRKMGKEMGFSIVGVKNKSHLFFKKESNSHSQNSTVWTSIGASVKYQGPYS